MTLIHSDPWSMLSRWQGEIQRLRDGRLSGSGDDDGTSIATSRWVPAVDILEEPDRFVLLADVPGVPLEDIEITMEDGVLTLKGERRDVAAHADVARRVERQGGTFHRRFALPDGVDADRVSAKGRHGVLEVSIPKVEQAKPRRIEVQG